MHPMDGICFLLRSEEHTSELQSRPHLVCRLLLESYADICVLHSFPTRRSSDLGYFLASTGVGFFDFSRTPDISEQEKRDFLQMSGISICINQLRGVIAALTANAPYGRYLLPSKIGRAHV